MATTAEVKALYDSIGRTGASAPTQDEINYWASQGGDVKTAFLNSASTFAGDPTYGANAALAQQQLQGGSPAQTTATATQSPAQSDQQAVAPDYMAQAAQLYFDKFKRAGDPSGIQYWAAQLAKGTPPDQVKAAFDSSAQTTYQNYANNPKAYDATNPGISDYFKSDPGASVAPQKVTTPPGSNLFNLGTNPDGTPNYGALIQQQYELNQKNAEQQMWMNNPNQFGPGGSQIRSRNPDGTYSVTTNLSPDAQKNFDAQTALQGNLIGRSNSLVSGSPLSYSGLGEAPKFDPSKAPPLSQFDTSGVQAIPTADANNLAQMRDSVYQQQTQYLDPQFQQAQSDLESKLANQGIMPGSEAYKREMGNFSLSKQKAYGDARNSAIQAGGQEQSRLFGLGLQANQAGQNNALNQFNTGLQAHVAGTNDALTQFNTGMQGRQQGVSEQNTLHNSPFNDLSSLRTGSQIQLPTYSGGVGTSIPGVDLMGAANSGFNANLGISNANAASNANMTNGLFSLGAAALQNPDSISKAWNWVTG